MIVVAGSLNMDLIGRVPRLPAGGETVLGRTLERRHGGKGGNQAVAAARLGAVVAFSGAVGADPFGDELVRGLQAEGIDTTRVLRAGETTGCALIAVADNGENTISVLPGANRLAPMPDGHWPLDARWLVLQLETPLEHVLGWAEAAHAQGRAVLLNAAPMVPLPAALLEATDLLVVNQGELERLAGSAPDVAAALARAAALGPQRVVATLGAQGIVAWDHGRVVQRPAHAVSVVDTTGAGDTFVGALAAGLDAGWGLDDALEHAVAAAAMACTRLGAREGSPRRNELDAWLARHLPAAGHLRG